MRLAFLYKWGKARKSPRYRAEAQFLASSRSPESGNGLVGLCDFMFTTVSSSPATLKHAT